MNKATVSLAQKLAELRVIPQNILPSTLKYKVTLPKIAELKIEYSKNAK